MTQMVKIDIDLVQYLTEVAEIIEILDDGIKFLTTKNGVVMRETVGKWGQVLCEENGVIWIEDYTEESWQVDKTEDIVMQINLPEGVEEVVKATSDVELTEMCEVAMEKAMNMDEIAIKLKEGVSPEDFVDALNKPASDVELTEMAEIAVEKPKKATKKKAKAVK